MLIIGFAVLHLLMFLLARPLVDQTLVAKTVLLLHLILLVHVAMRRGAMESAQIPACVAANMVGVALVLPIVLVLLRLILLVHVAMERGAMESA